MKSFCRSAHPDINTAVNLIETHLRSTIDRYNDGLREDALRRSRNNNDVRRETARSIHKKYYDDGYTTTRQYMSMICDLFEFKPQSRSTRPNEDTESEDEDIVNYTGDNDLIDSNDKEDDEGHDEDTNDEDDNDEDENDEDEDEDDNEDELDDELRIAIGMESLLQATTSIVSQESIVSSSEVTNVSQRVECKSCKKHYTKNNDGTIRKHRCIN
jgi:TATA-binding protein-associated factor Taf7